MQLGLKQTASDPELLSTCNLANLRVKAELGCCLDHLSYPITRIEGGAKAVSTSGDLVLQRVRVMYFEAYLYFWFDVDHE
ncbi:hypothetical protein Bca52824_082882 [Brassica carinata]|uniref:Uncharacterized protein n=1 Tax=Brassica carinata TaxID=52824 RepID=A0A8X7PJ27_BRACI|nr:hypothetical protein Bca52824_082882 [Brassica carinata]